MSDKLKPLTHELLAHVAELLQVESTLTLSVADAEGHPHAAAVFYVTGEGPGPAELDLYWLSSTTSQHSLCLAANPQAAIAIHRPTFVWKEIAGVQMRGLCSTIKGQERKLVLERYRLRFQLGTVLSLAIRQSTVYRFRPSWLRLSDNSKGFGWKQECELTDSLPPGLTTGPASA